LISEPTYEDPFNVNPATIGAIYDSESVNLSSVKTRGLDFGLGYKNTILGTGIDTGIDGGYIFAFDNQFSSVAPVVSILNTAYNSSGGPFNGVTIALSVINLTNWAPIFKRRLVPAAALARP
jgi:hypothetical protein